MKLAALDIETAPGPGFEEYEDAALDLNRSKITIIAVDGPHGRICHRDISELSAYADTDFITHGGKFDFKTLGAKNAPLDLNQFAHDTMLMGVALTHKIPQAWLDKYDEKRRALNAELGKKVHREAGKHSLKTMAPYFLGVDPFWEVADHNDEAYALKDVVYTKALFEELKGQLEKEGGWEFYFEKLMPWARMLTMAELTGVQIDFDLMAVKEKETQEIKVATEAELKRYWAPSFAAYHDEQVKEVRESYAPKRMAAIQKLKFPTLKDQEKAAARHAEKVAATSARYAELEQKAIEGLKPFNLNSVDQLKWLLKTQLGLDITKFSDDEESTGKAVLERLAGEGREDVRCFLNYRKAAKLVQAFFPSYREMAFNGCIHTNFNANGTRTGRLSSNGPNLQQVPGDLHALFKARPGKKLICYDLSNIEPLLIAYVTEDYNLCKLYIEEKANFHDKNVEIMFGIEKCDKKLHKAERDLAKEVGLSILYGAGKNRVNESSAKRGFPWGLKRSADVVKGLRAYYEGVWEYKTELDERIASGELIRNVFGRPVVVENADDIYMQGFNTFIQGSGSDLLLESTVRAWSRMMEEGLDAVPLLFVHDEVIVEAAEKDAERANAILVEELTRWELQTAYGTIRTSCEGGIFDNWRK